MVISRKTTINKLYCLTPPHLSVIDPDFMKKKMIRKKKKKEKEPYKTFGLLAQKGIKYYQKCIQGCRKHNHIDRVLDIVNFFSNAVIIYCAYGFSICGYYIIEPEVLLVF